MDCSDGMQELEVAVMTTAMWIMTDAVLACDCICSCRPAMSPQGVGREFVLRIIVFRSRTSNVRDRTTGQQCCKRPLLIDDRL